MNDEQIMAIRDAALARGDQQTYNTAWIALGYWRTVAFMPATADERARATAKLASAQP